jgi:alkylation response protein AidB-like acyl-CoA dehydrogenase
VAFARKWQRQLYDGGWAGITWPKEYGGRGASIVEQLIYNEEYARFHAPDILALKIGLSLVGPTVIACGTPQQKERFLEPILRGDQIWCQGFSEPNAGSDLASVKTKADLRGDEFVVTGQKIWTSVARHAETQRPDLPARRHEQPGNHHPAFARDDRRGVVQRSLLRRGPCAASQRRRRDQRRLASGDDHARI